MGQILVIAQDGLQAEIIRRVPNERNANPTRRVLFIAS